MKIPIYLYNDPTLFYVHNIAHMQAVQGQHTYLQYLAVGKVPLEVTRLDDNAIKITADGGTLY